MNPIGVLGTSVAKLLPITYAIIGFGILIIVHEFGHFLFCKMFNIHTPTFSIGIGPKLIERKIGKTNFRLSALPIGGYVEIAGLEEVGQGEQEHAKETGESALSSKPYWQRILVLMGGIIFNMSFAYLAFLALFMFGAPKAEVRIKSIVEKSIAQKFDFQPGDQLLKIGKFDIDKDPTALVEAIHMILMTQDEKIPFEIIRDGNKKEVIFKMPTIPLTDKILQGTGSVEAMPKQRQLGIEFAYDSSKKGEGLGFITSAKKSAITTYAYSVQLLTAIKMLFTQRTLKGAGGPVMIISQSIKLAQKGFIFLLMFLAVISINLAIINLIPLPIFDGGQILLTTIESIIGRELPFNIKNAIHLVSWLMILGLILYLTFNDIWYIVTGKLR